MSVTKAKKLLSVRWYNKQVKTQYKLTKTELIDAYLEDVLNKGYLEISGLLTKTGNPVLIS